MTARVPDPQQVTAAVAKNVRAQRAHRGLTLDALAARSGVSKGMLVQIEQGRTNPSVGTLTRVAEALRVSVATLVEVADVPAVRVVPAVSVATLWEGERGGTGRLLVGADRPAVLELWDWTLQPGEAHDGDAHPPGTRELLAVLDGTLTLVVDGAAVSAGAGEAVVFAADRLHRYANDGDRPVRVVMVVSEPATTPDAS